MGEWAVLRIEGKRGAISAVGDAWGTLRNVSEGWPKAGRTSPPSRVPVREGNQRLSIDCVCGLLTALLLDENHCHDVNRKLNHDRPYPTHTSVITGKIATFFNCVSGAMVVQLGYGVFVSSIGRSSNETDFEHVIGACVFFVVVWSEFRLQ